MALSLKDTYPGQVAIGDPDYPLGRGRNRSIPGAADGTPWEERVANDLFGFQQALLAEVSAVATNVADKVGASQYLDAIKSIVARIGFVIADRIIFPHGVDAAATNANGAGGGFAGAGTGAGVHGTGGVTNGHGVVGNGAGSGMGGNFTGGATNGYGAGGLGGGSGGGGVIGIGVGAGVGVTGAGGGVGVSGTGGDGVGVYGQGGAGGSGSHDGVHGLGSGSGVGVRGVGGSSDGEGVRGVGDGSAAAVHGVADSGPGGEFESTTGVGLFVHSNATRGGLRFAGFGYGAGAVGPSGAQNGEVWLETTTGPDELRIMLGGTIYKFDLTPV